MPSEFNHKFFLDCLHVAQSAAMQAGQEIMNRFGQQAFTGTGDKGYGYEKSDLVTDADRNAQVIIEKVLRKYDERIAFLAEENGNDLNQGRFEKDMFWSIDPLDGTKAFVDRNTGFAVSIGLVSKDHEPLMGVCYFPALGDLYSAINGRAAWHNLAPLQVNPTGRRVRLLISEAETLPKDKNAFYHQLRDSLTNAGFESVKPEVISAPVQKTIAVATSEEPCLYYGIPRKKLGVSLWDFAAATSVAKQAGCIVTDIYGEKLELNRQDSTFVHHKGFIIANTQELADIAMDKFKESPWY